MLSILKRKINRNRLNRRSVFLKLLLSYLFIFLLPISIGTAFYLKIEAVMEDNINHSNLAMLDQLKEIMDNQFKEVDQLAQQIISDPKLPVLLNQKYLDDQHMYNFLELRTEWERYRKNRLISDFYVYFANSDSILTPNLRTDSQTFYNKIYSYKDISYSQWKDQLLGGFQYKTYLPSSPVATANGTVNMVSYVTSLPLGETKDRKGSLVFLINESEVKRLLANTKLTKESNVWIVNNQQQMLVGSAEQSGFMNALNSRLIKNNDIFSIPFHGEEFVISYTSSNQLGWKYVSVTPTKVFMERVLTLKLWGALLLLLCLVGGILVCYLLAYRHYSPIRDLVNAMSGKSKDHPKIKNEFDFIKEKINITLAEDNQIREFLNQQTPMIQANFLMRVIRGYVDRSTVSEQSLDFMNIRSISDDFAVVIFEMYDMTRFTAEESERQSAFARFIISNISNELANAVHLGYTIELDRNLIALLFNVNKERNKGDEDLKKIVETLKDVVENRFNILLTVAVSKIHQGVEQIGECYREALDALDYKITLGHGGIFHFNEAPVGGERHYYYPIEVEVQLINLVKSADIPNVEQLLDSIYSINFDSHKISPELGRCLFFNIQSTFLKILNSMNLKSDLVLQDGFDPIKYLSNSTTVEDMHRKTRRLFRELCTYFRSNLSNQSEQLLNRISSYIQDHYWDGMLSLTSISDRFDITPQYLSNFFKKHKGENLTEYIAKIRVQKAKELLVDHTLPLSQIATMVGYASDIAFIRFFKKYEGITPGKYREQLEPC